MDSDKCRRYWEKMGHCCGICQVVCPWNHPTSWLHNTVRELNQSFPALRRFFIRAEGVVYGEFKPVPAPEWIRTPGTLEGQAVKEGTHR